jgi:hypothetical protein
LIFLKPLNLIAKRSTQLDILGALSLHPAHLTGAVSPVVPAADNCAVRATGRTSRRSLPSKAADVGALGRLSIEHEQRTFVIGRQLGEITRIIGREAEAHLAPTLSADSALRGPTTSATRRMTVSAWERPEDLEAVMKNPTHRSAMTQMFKKHGLGGAST